MEAEGDAVGTLFKIVEVFLWDDGRPDNSRVGSLHDGAVAQPVYSPGFDDPDKLLPRKFSTEIEVIEDLDLAQEMGVLGLPISFSTNKERRKSSTGVKKKVKPSHKEPESKLFDFCRTGKSTVSPDPQSSCDNEATSLDAVVEQEPSTGSCYIFEAEDDERDAVHEVVADSEIFEEQFSNCANHAVFIADISNRYEKQNTVSVPGGMVTEPIILTSDNHDLPSGDDAFDGSTCYNLQNISADPGCSLDHCRGAQDEHNEMEIAESCHIDSVESVQLSMLADHSTACDNCKCPSDLRNWLVAWDAFYMRTYYYNIVTEESTWNNPLCLGCLAILSNSDGIHMNAAEDSKMSDFTCNDIEDSEASVFQQINSSLGEEDDGNLTFQPFNGSTSRLNNGIVKLISDDKPSDCYHSSEDHQGNFLQSEINLPNIEQQSVAQALSWEAKYESASTEHNELCSEEGFRCKNNTLQTDLVQTDHPDKIFSSVSTEKKVKGTKSRQRMKCGDRNDLMLPKEMEGFSSDIVKYWCQRYLLFSKFDSGIKMDEEGWFSVTPELIARHHAERCCGGTVIDCFAGVGGNAIQFAMKSCHVIAIDIDPCKIDCARQNAVIYGVQDSIDFIQGDFFQLTSKLKGDVVFLSPPWGGPDYLKAEVYDMRTMLKPHDGYFLFEAASHLAPKIIMFLPRIINLNQLAELAQSVHPPWELEIEKNYLNGKLKAITAYFFNTAQLRA